jgi:hypothetical protein
VKHHIADVLANVDGEATSAGERRRLRLAALVHDTFKYRAPEASARVGRERHHGSQAATFLQRFVDDEELFLVVRWHDEVFAAWLGQLKGATRVAPRSQRAHSPTGSAQPWPRTSASSVRTTPPRARARRPSAGSSASLPGERDGPAESQLCKHGLPGAGADVPGT